MLNRSLMTGRCYLDGSEITPEVYMDVLQMYREKAELVDKLYRGEIGVDDVPAAWQKEIERRVAERIRAEQEEAELSAQEALDIILGGETA